MRVVSVAECPPGWVGIGFSPVLGKAGSPSGAPVYVPRDHDELLRRRLSGLGDTGGFLLVVGGPSAGKSRSLYEAVRTLLPEWRLFLPEGPAEVRAAIEGLEPRTVVWLDDTPTERYVTEAAGEGGLSNEEFHRLVDNAGGGPVIVVDTLWPERFSVLADRFTGAPELLSVGTGDHPDLSAALDPAPVEVSDRLSTAERVQAREFVRRDPRLRPALADVWLGFAQHLAGAPALIAAWKSSRSAEPLVHGLVAAALDARRLGFFAPLTRAFLQDAVTGYLPAEPAPRIDVAARIDGALERAVRNPDGTAGLLRSAAGGYAAAGYLQVYVERRPDLARPPASLWEACLAHAEDVADVNRLAESAFRRLLYRYSVPLQRAAAHAGDQKARAKLDVWLEARGWSEPRERPSADERPADLPPAGPLAYRAGEADDLVPHADDGYAREKGASWLADHDRMDEAIALLRRAADAAAGGPAARDANRRLAIFLSEHDRVDELRERSAGGDREAGLWLAGWLRERGRRDEEVRVLRPIAATGDEEARIRLAIWLADHDQVDELRERTDTGDEHARYQLADWLGRNDFFDEATRLLEGDDRTRTWAAGLLLDHGRGDELRVRADAGDKAAHRALLDWLLNHEDGVEGLAKRAAGGDHQALDPLNLLFYIRDPETTRPVERPREEQLGALFAYGVNADGTIADPWEPPR